MLKKYSNKFSPEINQLKNITKKYINENINTTKEILNKKEPLSKIIGEEIGKAIVYGPAKTIERVEEISEPLHSIAKKTVDIIAEQKDPVSQKITEVLKAHTEINPVNIVDKTEEIVKTYAKTASENVDIIGKEITKTVLKEKVNNAVKKSFLNRVIDFLKKIIERIKNNKKA